MIWYRVFILLCLLLFLGGCASFQFPGSKKNPHYAAGLDLINDQQYNRAIAEFQKVPSKDPDYQRAQNAIVLARTKLRDVYFREGKRLYEEGNYSASLDLLKRAEPHDPFYPEAARLIKSIQANDLFNEGIKYFNAGDYAKAGNAFRQALGQGAANVKEIKDYIGRSSENLINQGIQLYRQGELQKAISEWKKIFLFDPDNAMAKDFIKKATQEIQQLERLKKGQ